jgi:hypothetical protein
MAQRHRGRMMAAKTVRALFTGVIKFGVTMLCASLIMSHDNRDGLILPKDARPSAPEGLRKFWLFGRNGGRTPRMVRRWNPASPAHGDLGSNSHYIVSLQSCSSIGTRSGPQVICQPAVALGASFVHPWTVRTDRPNTGVSLCPVSFVHRRAAGLSAGRVAKQDFPDPQRGESRRRLHWARVTNSRGPRRSRCSSCHSKRWQASCAACT